MAIIITLTIIAFIIVKMPPIQMLLMHAWFKIVQPWPKIETQWEDNYDEE
jgi:hypothetical protein